MRAAGYATTGEVAPAGSVTATADSNGTGPLDTEEHYGAVMTSARTRGRTPLDDRAEATDQRTGRAIYGPQGGGTGGQTRQPESATNRRNTTLRADLVRFPS